LEDDSDASTKIKANIYSHFGYTPTQSTRQIGNDNVELSGGEKQVLLTTFEKKAREYLLQSPQRSRSRSTSQRSRTLSASRKRRTHRNSRAAENQ
jgi:hypothetical protein